MKYFGYFKSAETKLIDREVFMFANILWAANLPESEQLSWDIVRQIIESQYNLATLGIIVIIAVAALVAGASWFTNFYLVRYELKKTIESFNSEIIKIEKNLKDEVEKMEEKVVKAVGNVSEAMIIFNAEKARYLPSQINKWDGGKMWLFGGGMLFRVMPKLD
jgi:hypothetical protein